MIQINFVQELLVKYIIKGTLLYFIYYIYYIIYYNTAQICKLIKTDLYYSMEFLQESRHQRIERQSKDSVLTYQQG